jgi:transcriptional regulator with GAF, ATPase, and Fis domain
VSQTKVQALKVAHPELPTERLLAFERMLADLSARFAGVTAEQVDFELQTALGQLREFLGFDRCTFGEFSEDGSLFVLYSDVREGSEPMPRGPFPARFAWYQSTLRAGHTIKLYSIPEDIPPEAEAEREYILGLKILSNLGIPIRVGGRIIGAISFIAFRNVPAWSDDLVARLKLVGEVFAQALARKRSEEKLRAATEEIKSLKERLEQENAYLRQVVEVKLPSGLATRSARFKSVIEEVGQVAPTNSTVLLLGETGSGKEVLAQAIHEASGRRDRPMVKVNCAALPAALVESELFGREKGAFTGAIARQAGRFEIADGSTIFLDEVGELPVELQPKLLRVLQEGEFERLGGSRTIKVDVRVIAATNRPLAQAVSEGRFRQDLYYRLDVFPIQIPPLRERREDIPLLTWTFVKEFSKSMGKPIDEIADESMEALQSYPWPGNIRELRNVVERAMILAREPTLRIKVNPTSTFQSPAVKSTGGTLEEAERAHIVQTLERCGWRIRGTHGAATLLDIKPTTLESRMKKLGIALKP